MDADRRHEPQDFVPQATVGSMSQSLPGSGDTCTCSNLCQERNLALRKHKSILQDKKHPCLLLQRDISLYFKADGLCMHLGKDSLEQRPSVQFFCLEDVQKCKSSVECFLPTASSMVSQRLSIQFCPAASSHLIHLPGAPRRCSCLNICFS